LKTNVIAYNAYLDPHLLAADRRCKGVDQELGGGVLWVLSSAVAGEFGTGRVDSGMMTLVYLFGVLFYFSLPPAIVIEAVKWASRRRQKQVAVVSQSSVGLSVITPQATKFYTQCGTTLQTVGAMEGKCAQNISRSVLEPISLRQERQAEFRNTATTLRN
jgi:hypothetical protein